MGCGESNLAFGPESPGLTTTFNSLRDKAISGYKEDEGGSKKGKLRVAAAVLQVGARQRSAIFVAGHREPAKVRTRHAPITTPESKLILRIQDHMDAPNRPRDCTTFEHSTVFIFCRDAPRVERENDDSFYILTSFAESHPTITVLVGFQRYYYMMASRRSQVSRRKTWLETLKSHRLPPNLHFYQCEVEEERVTHVYEVGRDIAQPHKPGMTGHYTVSP